MRRPAYWYLTSFAILLMFALPAFSQTAAITGVITDAKGGAVQRKTFLQDLAS
jgi:Tfp pilus assembly protein FimT